MGNEVPVLSATDVCAILKACAEAQVSVMKFGSLSVRFGRKPDKDPRTEVVPDLAPVSDTKMEEVAREAIAKEAVLTKEDRLAMLQIEDPLEYERLLQAGELEKD